MQSFIVLCAKFHKLCAKKSTAVVKKFMSNSKVFSTNLHANEMSGLREFRTIFSVARKSICGHLS